MKPYPSILQSWGIFGIAVASMFIFIPLNSLFSDIGGAELGMFVYYLFSMSTPLILAHFLRKKLSGKSSYPFRQGNALIYFLLMITLACLQLGITIPLGNLIPMPEFIKEMFMELSSFTGIFGFLTIVIAAPILEEFIFRGIILDGLLKQYTPAKSILLSSFLFGIVHLNPWQFISAMVIGCFSGWIYYRTRNLVYSIFIHFINNLIPFIIMQYYSAEILMDMDMSTFYGSEEKAIYYTIGLCIMATILIIALNKRMIKSEVK
jgi:hypothetical protein